MPYIHFTEEQKFRASSVDLVSFLTRQGETLIPSGREKRLASNHSITVHRNTWYDHAAEQGGGPISFVQNFYGLSYSEAVARLLNGEQGLVCEPHQKQKDEPKKEFIQPPAAKEMRRLYAYLLKKRLIDRDVLNTFVRAGLIYEDANYHNAVFIGKDEHGVVRHAHNRSTSDLGKPFRINTEGGDPRYSFHWLGSSSRLYVFEAPIDLLSFLTLYSIDWQAHSYVALCGVSAHAMFWMLEQHPQLQAVHLCLDHDPAGIEAAGRLLEQLTARGYRGAVLAPRCKDWNEDVKAAHGLPAEAAQEHPQHIVAPEICEHIVSISDNVNLDRLETALFDVLEQHRSLLSNGQLAQAMAYMEYLSALALAAYRRGLRQTGSAPSAAELSSALSSRILPHQNRGAIRNRHAALSTEIQHVLSLGTAEDKQKHAAAWLGLAVSCAKIPVKYAADQLQQQEKQEQTQGGDLEMG